MNKKLLFIVFLILNSCSAITNMLLKNNGVFDTKSSLKILKSTNQKVVFIGMHHIGKKEFYNDVSIKIDSLQKLGYTTYYESVKDGAEIDSTTKKISKLKFRKLIGIVPEKYIDTANNIIGGKLKYRNKKHKLINQPSYPDMNIDTLTSIKADVGLTTLMAEFEKKHGEISIDSCDMKYELYDTKYNCKLDDKDFIINYRNKFLADKITNSKLDKILIIYGKSHLDGLIQDLKKIDNSWELIK